MPGGVPRHLAAFRKSDQAPRRGGEMLVCQRKLLDDARGNVLARLCNLPQRRNPFNHTYCRLRGLLGERLGKKGARGPCGGVTGAGSFVVSAIAACVLSERRRQVGATMKACAASCSIKYHDDGEKLPLRANVSKGVQLERSINHSTLNDEHSTIKIECPFNSLNY